MTNTPRRFDSLKAPPVDPEKAAEEARIDYFFARTFCTPDGQEVLKFLRNMTIEAVCPPTIEDSALRHLEGQRHLVRLIEARVRRAGKVTDAKTVVEPSTSS